MTLSTALGTMTEFKQHALELFTSLGSHPDRDLALTISDLIDGERTIIDGLTACMARHGMDAPQADEKILDELLSMEYFRLHAKDASMTDRATALDLAIQFAKDDLLLFTEIWSLCPDDDCRLTLHALIEIEKKHLLRLLDMRKKPQAVD